MPNALTRDPSGRRGSQDEKFDDEDICLDAGAASVDPADPDMDFGGGPK